MKVVNQGTTASRVVELLDQNGAPGVPTALSYRIDCVTSGQVVRALTPLTPAATVEITLTPADTAIVNPRNNQETKRLTVVAQYGGENDQVTGQFDYVVHRLPYLG